MTRNHLVTSLWHARGVAGWRRAISPARLLRYASASRRQLPDHIIAGVQKAGTTSLWAYLSQHPRVVPPITKEVNFFDRNYHRGLRWYRMHFPAMARSGSPDEPTHTGEASPNYSFNEHAPQRIARDLPDVKVILLLRNPVDRAFSQYQHRRRRRRDTHSFEAAIDVEAERLARAAETSGDTSAFDLPARDRYTYLARGLYFEQIRRWQHWFPPERLFILESGRFFAETAAVFGEVCDFVGLERWQPDVFGNRYPGGYRETMQPATRRKLVDYFAPHNARLFELLGTRYDWDR